ncbi:hypothetical protein ACFPOI_25075 [Nonomuraea angiospora]|uniref:Uncharacterized protein n=1 Tax=Nonomuraea angiospora TaxID=46172 RepID=A0ABR9LPJ5_9ACTN|nr:hypothetical protein [Nonomuraea angiospora]MBE1582574.1 hypothetical protein [Nonomuraea angiospora]
MIIESYRYGYPQATQGQMAPVNVQGALGVARSTLYRALEHDSPLAAAAVPVEASVDRDHAPLSPAPVAAAELRLARAVGVVLLAVDFQDDTGTVRREQREVHALASQHAVLAASLPSGLWVAVQVHLRDEGGAAHRDWRSRPIELLLGRDAGGRHRAVHEIAAGQKVKDVRLSGD